MQCSLLWKLNNSLFYYDVSSPWDTPPPWDLKRFYFFGLRTYENWRDRAQPSPGQPSSRGPGLCLPLVDMFIQMNINSLYFWLFAFYFFVLPHHLLLPSPKEKSYFIRWYNYFF